MRCAIERLSGLDWLVISAGQGWYLAPYEMNEEEVEKIVFPSLLGRIQVYRACVRELIASEGSVLLLGSTVATHGAKGLSVYAAAMAGNEGFMRSEALRMRRANVRMNVLSPGWVDTPMTRAMRADFKRAAAAWMPDGRFLKPSEVGEKAVEILNSNLTGEVVEFLRV